MLVKKLIINPDTSIIEIEKDGRCLLKLERGQLTGPLVDELSQFIARKIRLDNDKVREHAREKIEKIVKASGKDDLDPSQVRKILVSLLEYLSIVR